MLTKSRKRCLQGHGEYMRALFQPVSSQTAALIMIQESERGGEIDQCILADILETVDAREGSALTEVYEVAKDIAITAFEGEYS